jgi:hypothetical protein
MPADGHALELELAGVRVRSDQAEISGAASDVTDQDRSFRALTREQALDSRFADAAHEVVKGSLRLLEQTHCEAGALGRFDRELARCFVEGRGYGEDH